MSPSCSKALMWWKAKKASLCKVRSTRPSSFRTTKNFAPCSGFQAKVFDERLATHQQFERINQQGKLRQNYVVLRHAKAVQISRFGGGDGANDPPLELLVNKEDIIAGFAAILHHLVYTYLPRRVIVRVGGRCAKANIVLKIDHAYRFQRLRVKGYWQRRLGHRQKLASQFGEVDVGIVAG